MEQENKPVLKIILSILVFFLGGALVAGYIYNNNNNKNVSTDQSSTTTVKSVQNSEVSGHVVSVNGKTIVVDATVSKEIKTIEFTTDTDTVFNRTVLGITHKQLTSGKPYKPTQQTLSGSISDIIKDMNVMIKTSDDLSTPGTKKVVSINYVTYDFQN